MNIKVPAKPRIQPPPNSHAGVTVFPLESLTSPCGRVTLEPLEERHLRDLYAVAHPASWTGTNGNTHPYFAGFPYGPFAAYDDWVDFVRRTFFEAGDTIMFAVYTTRAPDGTTAIPRTLVGKVGLIATSVENQRTEVGHVWYDTRYRGTFVNKAAVAAVLAWCFEGLGFSRVEWKCHSANEGSRRAAESLGFVYEGTFRKHMVVRHGFKRTTIYLAMTDDDWPSVKGKLWGRLGVSDAVE
ncbi:hypothetical protein H9P43_001872 [Blastocladiella emersonii ATCC 22665]|nr:hypothetical protein H9P43_001872 [Blastocladiella emersonii ATCC 22665]